LITSYVTLVGFEIVATALATLATEMVLHRLGLPTGTAAVAVAGTGWRSVVHVRSLGEIEPACCIVLAS
jgi:hypothetical protein